MSFIKSKMDYSKSEKVYAKYRTYIRNGLCYNNIMDLTNYWIEIETLLNCELSIGYCYIDTLGVGILNRHCVFIDKDNTIIDPTVIGVDMVNDGLKSLSTNQVYYVFLKLSRIEFIRNMMKNIRFDMLHTQNELNFYNEIMKENPNTLLLEHDYITYIYPMLK